MTLHAVIIRSEEASVLMLKIGPSCGVVRHPIRKTSTIAFINGQNMD